MDVLVMEKCLDFCQGLVQSNHKFSFNFSCGKDTFNFDNKELAHSSWKKKKSPSQLRREKMRRETRMKLSNSSALSVKPVLNLKRE